jgi:hypothetical protein
MLDAAVRVVVAYALPVSDVPALAGAPWLVTFLLLQIITNVYLSRSGLWPSCTAISRPSRSTHQSAGRYPSSIDLPRSQPSRLEPLTRSL